jgi:hypothetical protein
MAALLAIYGKVSFVVSDDDIERGVRDEELEGRTHSLGMKQLQ